MHRSSRELVEFLTTAHKEVLFDLTRILGDRAGFNDLKTDFPTSDQIPSGLDERQELATRLVNELGYFASNNISYWTRAIADDDKAVGYHEALLDVCETLNKQLKKSIQIPRVATVAEREMMVCSQLLSIALQGKSEEQIVQMLADANLKADAQKARAIQSAVLDGSGTAIIALVKIVGKKTVTNLSFSALNWIITKKLGQEAAEKLILALAKQTAQKTVALFTVAIGAALIAWDVLSLTGPATRVTVPAIGLIATVRCAKRLEEAENGTVLKP